MAFKEVFVTFIFVCNQSTNSNIYYYDRYNHSKH
jgi:hypothetical protein